MPTITADNLNRATLAHTEGTVKLNHAVEVVCGDCDWRH